MNKYIGEWYFEDIIAHIDKFELGTKIRSERGDVYNLSQTEGEGKQRKFSRWNGTRLRFMTYENIGKKFEILEDNTEEIDILNIEEIQFPDNTVLRDTRDLIVNQLVQAVKQLDRKINNK